MTRREMLSRMDSKEYAEWLAYDTLEPLGNYPLAVLWCLLRNALRGSKDTRAYEIQDCPFIHEPKPEQSMDEMKAILRSAFGGRP